MSRALRIRAVFAVYFLIFIVLLIPQHDQHHSCHATSAANVLDQSKTALTETHNADLCLLCKTHGQFQFSVASTAIGIVLDATAVTLAPTITVVGDALPSDLSPRAPPVSA